MEDSIWIAPSFGSTLAFGGVLALVVGCFIVAMTASYDEPKRGALAGTAGALLWVALTSTYVLVGGTRAGIPGLIGFFLISNVSGVLLAFSPLGTRLIDHLPLVALAAFQVFRLPLELVLHSWGEQGTMPIQMTFEGHNFDILTGALALVIAAYWLVTRKDPPRWVLLGFNVLGSALLLAVIVIVLLSSPLPIKTYDGPPILVAMHLPSALIVPVCVAGALSAHLMLWRALFRKRG